MDKKRPMPKGKPHQHEAHSPKRPRDLEPQAEQNGPQQIEESTKHVPR
jgi:hypothetical protein